MKGKETNLVDFFQFDAASDQLRDAAKLLLSDCRRRGGERKNGQARQVCEQLPSMRRR